MPEPQVSIIALDPYHPVTSLLVPFVVQRMKECAELYFAEMSPDAYLRDIMARFYNRDPRVAIVAMVDAKGVVQGHAVATIESDGVNAWCFISQAKADGNVGSAVHDAMELCRQWAKRAGCAKILMATGRSERAMERSFGFKLERRILGRDVEDEKKG